MRTGLLFSDDDLIGRVVLKGRNLAKKRNASGPLYHVAMLQFDGQAGRRQSMATKAAAGLGRRELGKAYEPGAAEAHWYAYWRSQGYFKPLDRGKGSFVVVMPPPNVTGELHMGHALFSTVEDILV